MKRSYSDGSQADDGEEETTNPSMLLNFQNKSLCKEMKVYKRQLTEARRELELMRRKSREMEALVSVIQRAWSQLDIDIGMLLDGLGDSEGLTLESGNGELLVRLLNAGAIYSLRDPTDMNGLPELKVDEWSTAIEVESERQIALEQFKRSTENVQFLDDSFSGTLEENLAGHATFTYALLQRLLSTINESGLMEHSPEVLVTLEKFKEESAQRLLLVDRIEKLSAEVLDIKARLHISLQQKGRAEKHLDVARTELASVKEKLKSAALSPGGFNFENGSQLDNGGGDSSTSGRERRHDENSAIEKDLNKRILLLEKQVSESEAAKARAEMTLTERLARPLAHTEAQVKDMRHAMEELRQQCKQRVLMYHEESVAMLEKVQNLEAALEQVESQSTQQLRDVVAHADEAHAEFRQERERLEADLSTAKAQVEVTGQLRVQVAALESLEATARADAASLRKRMLDLGSAQQLYQQHLELSRRREAELERALQATLREGNGGSDAGFGDSGRRSQINQIESNLESTAASSSSFGSSSSSDSKRVSDSEYGQPGAAPVFSLAKLLESAQARSEELQAELGSSKAIIDDLIQELDAHAQDEGDSREQAAKLLRQVTDGQHMQTSVLEENLRLHDQLGDLQRQRDEMLTKVEAAETALKAHEGLVTQLRTAETSVRAELAVSKRQATDDKRVIYTLEQDVLEAKQKLEVAEKESSVERKRNQELQTRCDELSEQAQAERKARMDAQREAQKRQSKREREKAAEGSSSSSGSGGGGADGVLGANGQSMAEIVEYCAMLKSMLKCSVCNDRFKEVAISRCFHLFCKECIDENIRNRNRKCPACGEKFGADDIKSVYFSN